MHYITVINSQATWQRLCCSYYDADRAGNTCAIAIRFQTSIADFKAVRLRYQFIDRYMGGKNAYLGLKLWRRKTRGEKRGLARMLKYNRPATTPLCFFILFWFCTIGTRYFCSPTFKCLCTSTVQPIPCCTPSWGISLKLDSSEPSERERVFGEMSRLARREPRFRLGFD